MEVKTHGAAKAAPFLFAMEMPLPAALTGLTLESKIMETPFQNTEIRPE